MKAQTIVFPLIERLGGRAAIAQDLPYRSKRPTIATIHMWHSRRNLPGEVILGLMDLAEARGLDTSSADYQAMTLEEMIRLRLDLADHEATPLPVSKLRVAASPAGAGGADERAAPHARHATAAR